MNVSEALEARRSVRYFQNREVPEETLRSIVKDLEGLHRDWQEGGGDQAEPLQFRKKGHEGQL